MQTSTPQCYVQKRPYMNTSVDHPTGMFKNLLPGL
jgi:hypothetical protein